MKKKLFAVIAILTLLALPVVGLASTAHAEGVKTGGNVIVSENETIDRTLFASGNTVDIAGTVDGDVICAGQNVTVSGTVRGDVICAGQNVRVTGTVEGDIRLAGQVVTVSGEVDGNATIAAQTFTTDEGSVVRDLSVGASVVTLNGEIQRDAYVGAQTATVNGHIARNVQADVQHVTLGSDARVNGNVAYTSDNKAERREGAQVAGQLIQQEPEHGGDDGSNAGQALGGIAFILMLLLVVSMTLVALFPRVLQSISNNGVDRPGRTLLIGAITVLLSPVLILILMASVIGSLLGLLLFVAYLLVLFLSGPVFGYYVGRMLLYKTTINPLLYMLLGSVIVGLLYFVPFVGALAVVAAGFMGSGMIIGEVMRRSVRPVYAVESKPKAKRK